jgi:glycerol kinase
MLCNIHTAEWDEELLRLFDIPAVMLPKIKSNSEVYGYTENVLTGKGIPVSRMAGDQQAALFGQMCIEPGMVKNTYGTGCFMLMNTGTKPVMSKNNLLTTIAWKIQHEIQYALEGSVFIAGAVVQWLRDGLQVIRTSAEIESCLKMLRTTEAYSWFRHSRTWCTLLESTCAGNIVGITRGTTSSLLRAKAIESIAYQTMDVPNQWKQMLISNQRIESGRWSDRKQFVDAISSDILNTKGIRPQITETTALGAAYLAGIGVGYFNGLHEIQQYWKQERIFTPQMRRR